MFVFFCKFAHYYNIYVSHAFGMLIVNKFLLRQAAQPCG